MVNGAREARIGQVGTQLKIERIVEIDEHSSIDFRIGVNVPGYEVPLQFNHAS